MSPCMCDVLNANPGFLLSEVQITSSSEEEVINISIEDDSNELMQEDDFQRNV